MDDGVLVEPRLGVRPWAASATFEEGLRILLGRMALNVKKLAEEGAFDTKALLWGLGYDTEAGTCQLPEQILLKGAHLLTEPCFDPGNRAILLIELQRFRGNATYWTTCQPRHNNNQGTLTSAPKVARNRSQRPIKSSGTPLKWVGGAPQPEGSVSPARGGRASALDRR